MSVRTICYWISVYKKARYPTKNEKYHYVFLKQRQETLLENAFVYHQRTKNDLVVCVCKDAFFPKIYQDLVSVTSTKIDGCKLFRFQVSGISSLINKYTLYTGSTSLLVT